jgi:hypothetical protein
VSGELTTNAANDTPKTEELKLLPRRSVAKRTKHVSSHSSSDHVKEEGFFVTKRSNCNEFLSI